MDEIHPLPRKATRPRPAEGNFPIGSQVETIVLDFTSLDKILGSTVEVEQREPGKVVVSYQVNQQAGQFLSDETLKMLDGIDYALSEPLVEYIRREFLRRLIMAAVR